MGFSFLGIKIYNLHAAKLHNFSMLHTKQHHKNYKMLIMNILQKFRRGCVNVRKIVSIESSGAWTQKNPDVLPNTGAAVKLTIAQVKKS
jgi:hypothetical protein